MELKIVLDEFKAGNLPIEEAYLQINQMLNKDLEFAKIDKSRQIRTGIPEVIFGSGKSVSQVKQIAQQMYDSGIDILVTRANTETYEAVKEIITEAIYNPLAKTIVYKKTALPVTESSICIVTAGTSDIPVAEEAMVTAEFLGNKVVKIYDVGVAGIHRLFGQLELIRQSKVIIVVAGMEGALASVLGGLVDKPIIGVPTSIGYGANFGGLSALLAMLNSCANGISVVNIDNGFGAACQANLINKL